MWGEGTEGRKTEGGEKGLNYCLLPAARTEEELGSLTIADLWPTQKTKRDITQIGVEACGKNASGWLL